MRTVLGVVLMVVVGCGDVETVSSTGEAGAGGTLAAAGSKGTAGAGAGGTGVAGTTGTAGSVGAGGSTAGAPGGAGGAQALRTCEDLGWTPGQSSPCSGTKGGLLCSRCTLPGPPAASDLPCASSTAAQHGQVLCVLVCSDCD